MNSSKKISSQQFLFDQGTYGLARNHFNYFFNQGLFDGNRLHISETGANMISKIISFDFLIKRLFLEFSGPWVVSLLCF